MNNINPYFDLVDRYLEDDLSDTEKAQFNVDLSINPELKKEYDLQKKVNSFLGDKDFHEFFDKMNKIEDDLNLEKGKSKQKRYLWYAAAASVVIIMGANIFSPIFYQTPSGTELFAKNYEIAPSVLNNRSNSDDLFMLDQGLVAFDEARFEQSSFVLKEYLREHQNHQMAQFYLALSHIEMDQMKEAITSLIPLSIDENSLYNDQACWYLALTYIKTEQFDKAIIELEKISQQKHYKKDEALELLKKLD